MIVSDNFRMNQVYEYLAIYRDESIEITYRFGQYTIYCMNIPIAILTKDKFYLKLSAFSVHKSKILSTLRKVSKKELLSSHNDTHLNNTGTYYEITDDFFDDPDLFGKIFIDVIKRVKYTIARISAKKNGIKGLLNIDAELEKGLLSIGLKSLDDLSTIGSRLVYMILKQNDNNLAISALYRLEAATQCIPVELLALEEINELTKWWKKCLKIDLFPC